MAIAKAMTDAERKALALEYLTAFDNAGVTPSGGSILDYYAGRDTDRYPWLVGGA